LRSHGLLSPFRHGGIRHSPYTLPFLQTMPGDVDIFDVVVAVAGAGSSTFHSLLMFI
jgi:hypothetical protein